MQDRLSDGESRSHRAEQQQTLRAAPMGYGLLRRANGRCFGARRHRGQRVAA
jgi:hypothetical protein